MRIYTVLKTNKKQIFFKLLGTNKEQIYIIKNLSCKILQIKKKMLTK